MTPVAESTQTNAERKRNQDGAERGSLVESADDEAFADDRVSLANVFLRMVQLFGVGFRSAGVGGDDCGSDYHADKRESDKKVMHLRVAPWWGWSELVHTLRMP